MQNSIWLILIILLIIYDMLQYESNIHLVPTSSQEGDNLVFQNFLNDSTYYYLFTP